MERQLTYKDTSFQQVGLIGTGECTVIHADCSQCDLQHPYTNHGKCNLGMSHPEVIQ